MLKSIFKIFALIFLIFICAVGYLYLNQRNMMYHPDKAVPDACMWEQAGGQVVSVTTSDGIKLKSWYRAPQIKSQSTQAYPTILFFHGNTGSHASRATKISPFLQAGYGVYLAGYRGFGGNDGTPSEQGLYSDARAHVSVLENNFNTQPQDIVLYGESLGTGIAVEVASEEGSNFKALILEAPYTSTVDVARLSYGFLPLKYMMHDQYNSADKPSLIDEPVMIVHGQKDTVIPYNIGENLFKSFAQNSPSTMKRFIPYPKAGHNDLYDYDAALHILKFLSSIDKEKAFYASP